MGRFGRALSALLGLLLVVTGCSKSGGGHGASSSSPPSATGTTSVWDRTLAQVHPDGSVDPATALSAFVQAIGPVPGVSSPGASADLTDGTVAVRWVTAHWSDLTPAQQAAVRTDLGAPPSSGAHGFVAAGFAGRPAPAALTTTTTSSPEIPCLTRDSAGTAAYRQLYDSIADQLAAHLGPLRVRDHVFFAENTRQIGQAQDPAYTVGCVGGGDAEDYVSGCTIHVNPVASPNRPSTDPNANRIQGLLIHELTHCYFFAQVGVLGESKTPDWFAEGAPTWTELSLENDDDFAARSWWRRYVGTPELPLPQRTYDGVGFFVHLQDAGIDPWGVLSKMALAMARGGGTAAGWNVSGAGGSERFLESWGPGYAEGHYPGAEWTTGDGNRFPLQYLNAYHARSLANDGQIPFSTNAAATGLLKLDVSAEIVQVTPDANAHGLLSLGNGAQTTLAVAQGQNYCTLATADCHCPADSEQAGATFTHLEPGTEWLGLTGGLSTASVQVQGISFEDFCKRPASCVVGKWTSRLITATAPPYPGHSHVSSGGRGVRLTIEANGRATVDYDGMSRIDFTTTTPIASQSGFTVWSGTQTGQVTLPKAGIHTGVWSAVSTANAVDVASTITAPYSASGSYPLTYYYAQGRSPDMVSALSPGTFSCSGAELTLAVVFHGTNATGTGHWTLVRG